MELCPTTTLLKVKLVGEGVRTAAAVPPPDKLMVRVGFEAVEVTVTAPVEMPEDVGANFTVNEVLCPAARVIGVVTPERL